MIKIKQIMDKVLSAVCAVLLAFMSILVGYQVFTRYVLNNPSTFSEDLLTYAFVWMSLLGTALVFGQSDHMRLAIFVDKIKGKGQVALTVITELIILVITVIIFWNGGNAFMNIGATQLSPTLGIYMYYIYAILPLTGILIIAYCILNIGMALTQLRKVRGEEEK